MFLWCHKIVTPAVNNLMAKPMTGCMQIRVSWVCLLLTGGSRELAINLNAAKALGLNEAAAMGSLLI